MQRASPGPNRVFFAVNCTSRTSRNSHFVLKDEPGDIVNDMLLTTWQGVGAYDDKGQRSLHIWPAWTEFLVLLASVETVQINYLSRPAPADVVAQYRVGIG